MHLRHLAFGFAAILSATSAPLAAQSDGDAAMALLPYLAERAGPDGNLIYSPVSVNQAAAIADIEAGTTSLANSFKPALAATALNSADRDVTVRVGNALWLAPGIRLSQAAEAKAVHLGTTTRRVEFRRPERLAGQVNGWVAKATDGQIANVFAPREIDPADRAMVTGAVFFDGEWATPLKGRTTATFKSGSGAARNVPFLTGTAPAALASSGGWTGLRMPYTNPRYVMDVIMPQSGAALPDAATISALGAALDAAPVAPVAVRLPEFTVGYETGLIEALGAIGVQWPGLQAREQVRANVRPDRNRFGIDAVKLAAKLELFDSDRSAGPASGEASAAIRFAADRPFLLLVRDREQDALLFVTRIADPTARHR